MEEGGHNKEYSVHALDNVLLLLPILCRAAFYCRIIAQIMLTIILFWTTPKAIDKNIDVRSKGKTMFPHS